MKAIRPLQCLGSAVTVPLVCHNYREWGLSCHGDAKRHPGCGGRVFGGRASLVLLDAVISLALHLRNALLDGIRKHLLGSLRDFTEDTL